MAITSSSFFEDETSMSPFTLGQQFFTISLNVSVVNSPLRNQIIASTLLDRAIGEWSLSTRAAPRKDVRSFTTVAYLFSNLRGAHRCQVKQNGNLNVITSSASVDYLNTSRLRFGQLKILLFKRHEQYKSITRGICPTKETKQEACAFLEKNLILMDR